MENNVTIILNERVYKEEFAHGSFVLNPVKYDWRAEDKELLFKHMENLTNSVRRGSNMGWYDTINLLLTFDVMRDKVSADTTGYQVHLYLTVETQYATNKDVQYALREVLMAKRLYDHIINLNILFDAFALRHIFYKVIKS